VRAALIGAGEVASATAHLVHALWLQITGLFFLVFALIGVSAAIREYRAWHSGDAGPEKFWLAIAFAVVFGYFSFTSFLRSGRKRRKE
jgi:hypothetical protein